MTISDLYRIFDQGDRLRGWIRAHYGLLHTPKPGSGRTRTEILFTGSKKVLIFVYFYKRMAFLR